MLLISRFFFCYLMLGIITDFCRILQATHIKGNISCGGIVNCLKCDKGAGTIEVSPLALHTNTNSVMNGPYRCIKCYHMIVLRTRECVDNCPPGYTEEWSTLVDYMGRVCKESMIVAGIPLTGQKFAIVLGVSVGIVFCIVIVISGTVCMKYRRKKCLQAARQSPTLGHLTGTHCSQDSDDSERPEFLKQLAFLRPDAPVFLAMLNETRKQVRELRRPTRQNSALQAYRPVLKDLSRILILLNRPEDVIGSPPGDWETLLAWGERVLRRYKKQNPDQVSQLLGFMQLPLEESESPVLDHSPYPTQLTTFSTSNSNKHHISPTSSSNHLQQLAISVFDAAYNNQTRRGKEGELIILRRNDTSNTLTRPVSFLDSGVDLNSPNNGIREWDTVGTDKTHSTILAEWPPGNVRKSYYTDEERFYTTLGFRPQDEITTEL